MTQFANYADAEANSFDLIPKGTLCFARVKVDPVNYESGRRIVSHTSQRNEANRYMKLELTLISNDKKVNKRKIFDMVMTASDNADVVSSGRTSIRAMLEAAGRNPAQVPLIEETGEPDLYAVLNGRVVAIRVGIQEEQDGYDAKNTVQTYLSPVENGNGNKNYVKLVEQENDDVAKQLNAQHDSLNATQASAAAPSSLPASDMPPHMAPPADFPM